MPKSIFKDMVKVNQSRRPVEREVLQNLDFEPVKKSRNTLWVVAVVAVIFFLFSLSYLFSRAEVSIVPKIIDFNLNQNLSAVLNGDIESLPFEMVTISGEESVAITATEKKDVSQNAKGVVVIFNKFSSLPQRLDINTRLEGSNGKIYKTEKAIVVPGMTGVVPGSVEVVVYGAEGGEAYNSGPLDFKIFGFKGSPKYEKFYGRSKGDLSGGFIGSSFVVSETEKTKAFEDLKVALQNKLFKKALGQIPKGFVLFKKASTIEIEDPKNDLPVSTENILSLNLKGTFYGLLFKENDLTQRIAEKSIAGYKDEDVYIANINDLVFSLTDNTVPFKDLKNINFVLSGKAVIVWKLDAEKLKSELVGKRKSDFNQILSEYSNITSANLSLSPIWNRSMPDKLKDIKVIVNYPK